MAGPTLACSRAMTCNDQSPAALLAAACQQESGSSLGAGLGQLDHAVDDDQRDLESERPRDGWQIAGSLRHWSTRYRPVATGGIASRAPVAAEIPRLILHLPALISDVIRVR